MASSGTPSAVGLILCHATAVSTTWKMARTSLVLVASTVVILLPLLLPRHGHHGSHQLGQTVNEQVHLHLQ